MTGLLVLLALTICGAVCLVIGSLQRARLLARDGQRFRIVLPAEIPGGAVEHLVLALHGTLRPLVQRVFWGQPWLAVELHATPQGVEYFLWASGGVSEAFIRAHVEAALPGARVEPAPPETPIQAATGLVVRARGGGLVRTDVPRPGLAGI